jgi:AraC family ethanolamine operon transcriptional activator
VLQKSPTAECVVSFHDQGIEDFANCLHGFDLDFRQLDSGRFRARTIAIDLAGLCLKRRTTSVRAALFGKPPPALIMYFPLNPRPIFVRGNQVGSEVQLVSVAAADSFAILPGSYDHLLVCVCEQELVRCLGTEQAAWLLGHARRMDHCYINQQRKISLTRRLFSIFSGILYGSKAPNAEQCRQFREEIVALLHDYLKAHPDPQRKVPGSQERLLQRVLMLIESRPTHAFSLDELSREAFASKRAIQYAFEELVGLSPLRYVKLNRLNGFRKELVQGTELSLGSLVSKYNFSNQGRLVREYTELFGERPRDTVRHFQETALPLLQACTSIQSAYIN